MDAFWSLMFPPMSRRPSWLRFAHPVVVVGLLGALYWLQSWLHLDRYIRSPWPILHPYWLAAFAGLLYLGARLLVRLNRWTVDREERLAPAGWEEAWTAAMAALGRSSATWQSRPVYLALGETSAALEHLLSAEFRPMPEQAPVGIPFRVWSREDAIFVCAGEREHEGAGDRANRLALLAQMMARRADPRLPFLGIITFLTLDRLASLEDAQAAGNRMRLDVQTVTEAVGQDSPVVAFVLDAERLSGFEAWASERDNSDQDNAKRMWGIPFAHAADSHPLEMASDVAAAVRKFCSEQGPSEIRSAIGEGIDEASTKRNRDLFRLAGALPSIGPRLATFVKHVSWAEAADPPPLLGLYLSGTRAEPGATAFLDGITDVLAQGREYAGWTYRTIEEDWTFRRLTRWAMGGMGVAAVVLTAAGLWTIRRF
ncbi:MAG: hypothetical protein K2X38_23175 [Gemmataceae bacterium]|nr:hypothetical protein [Gemmataceae bacterium]